MKRILVLGAGMVGRPLVEYLLSQPDFFVEVSDIAADKPRRLVGDHARGRAGVLDLDDEAELGAAVKRADLVVSLAPAPYHPKIALRCLEFKKHLVTASYVNAAMAELDAEARKAGLVFLNELGLDPGIDHMESMRIIHDIRERGGDVHGFESHCGGLPAPEANTNPWGYKFSWSPTGVLRACNNPAGYLQDGLPVELPPERWLSEPRPAVRVTGLPEFEVYPNRDSLQYVQLYGIPETKTMLRGTLRYPGWCRTMSAVRRLGWLEETPRDWGGLTYEDFIRQGTGISRATALKKGMGQALGLAEDSDVIRRIEWLGLLEAKPVSALGMSPLEVLAGLMADRLKFAAGERDMVVLQHTFAASFPQGRQERIVSTLVDFGIPGGDSSMARTVGLPAAIGARLILQGKITSVGVQIPVLPEIYGPVLDEMKRHGIAFREERSSA